MNTILSFVSSKKVMATLLLFISALSFSQIVVTDVFPTRVTKSSIVTIIGDLSSGFTNSTTVSLFGISTSSVEATPDGSELSFEITLDGTASFSSDLKVAGQNVYIGSVSTANKVTIDYVGAKLKRNHYTSGSESFEHVTDIITNWNYNTQGYWRYSTNYTYGTSSTYPNDSHELLAFEYDGVFYSTGVDDDLLDNITGLTYSKEVFKAYSTNGITGTINNGANFIATGDMVDGVVNEGTNITSTDILDLTVFQVMVDGVNGLDLGTGVTNYNKSASIRFFSGNGQVGAISDGVPDLIITQIADSGSWDIYYYADDRGNVVGRPIKMYLNNGTNNLGRWALDLYSLPSGADINTANPQSRTFGNNETRLIKIVAFNLEDFDILTSDDIDSVKNINSVAGGSADMAFIAYNQSAFDIKAPIAEPILPQFVCKADGTTGITFSVIAGIDDGSGGITDPPAGDADLELKYKWRKYNSEISGETSENFTIGGVASDDLATYKVEISNKNGGTIILPVTLSEGGTPYYWNGTAWSSPYGAVVEKERGLVYTGEYAITGNLVGCDCKVTSGANVVMPKGSKMVLYNELTVEPEIAEVKLLDEFGNTVQDEEGDDIILVSHVPEATFTLEDNASLVQINDVVNSGEIKVKRTLDNAEVNQYDYVYWASPVAAFNISGISNTPTYQWDVNAVSNDSGVGNWVSAANATMTPGEGYIVRVSNSQLSGFTTEFFGEPNNGPFTIGVEKSSAYLTMDYNDSSWNLIGNPYPSAIDAETFLTANTNLEGRVDIWTHDTGLFDVTGASDAFYDDFGVNYGNQYITFNSTGTSTPDPSNTFNGKIASGQAFFVRVDDDALDTEDSVNFTNAMRHNNIVAHDNNQFHRSTSEETIALEKQLVWLSLANENDQAISTLVGYANGATEGKDRLYDAYTNNEGFNLYSLITEDEKLVIQGLPLPFVDTNTVPLGIELNASGIYKIAIGKVEGSLFVDQEQDIYLEDTYTNVIHDLRTSPYSFTGEAGEFNDRFILRYTPSSTLSISEVSVADTFAYISNATLHLKSSNLIESATVYDMNGKQITNYNVDNRDNSFDTEFRFSKGIYIVSITLDNGTVVTKKLIN
ncbi:T9SS type A sorting domain-containing protein [Winogradskyella helgolandensis]|uniref:T9SS type A sorting domain-containing protein n=1 Tax=Winogradskyella helgolandensis TaxID=2697010 RepID=UPI0015C7A385|nr:T9SS type A sorting domain-containing protein [Winogradskyella helgolandensis]